MRKVFILALLMLTLSAFLTACGGGGSGGSYTLSINPTPTNGTGGGLGGSYTLSINPTPTNGTVTSTPAGINCGSGGSACSASFSSQ
jgi:hypothetical protein